MRFPDDVAARLLPRHAFDAVTSGESGAGVWRGTARDAPPVYLKAAPLTAGLHLDEEAARLRWMKDHGVRVPAVLECGRIGGTEFLVLEKVAGRPASDPEWATALPEVMTALGIGLAELQRTSIAECPFDQRVARQVESARHRVAAGRVQEDDFDEIRAGARATDLLRQLVAVVPAEEDLVFTHGDFCLPNIILDRDPARGLHVAGLVDCGRAGVADRHQDLALALRSIARNFGSDWVTPFLDAYGLRHPDEEKLSFFTLLDEFF